jgi:hypothetical protein
MKKNDTALNMLLPGKLYADAKKAADLKNISLASLVRMALTEWLENENHRSKINEKSAEEIFNAFHGDIVRGGELIVR